MAKRTLKSNEAYEKKLFPSLAASSSCLLITWSEITASCLVDNLMQVVHGDLLIRQTIFWQAGGGQRQRLLLMPAASRGPIVVPLTCEIEETLLSAVIPAPRHGACRGENGFFSDRPSRRPYHRVLRQFLTIEFTFQNKEDLKQIQSRLVKRQISVHFPIYEKCLAGQGTRNRPDNTAER